MKKIRFLIFMFILLFIVFVLFLVIKKTKNDENISGFPLVEILEEVNLASNERFTEIGKFEVTKYIPIELSNYENLLIAMTYDNNEEYFIVGKNLDKEQQIQIERFYSNISNEEYIIFYSDDDYTYLIKSEEYLYMIEGIITSFMSNERDKK